MHPKILFTMSLAATVAASEIAADATSWSNSVNPCHLDSRSSVLAVQAPVARVTAFMTVETGNQKSASKDENTKRQALEATLTSLSTLATQHLPRYLDTSSGLEYLAEPGQMSTMTPHYPSDAAAQLQLGLTSQKDSSRVSNILNVISSLRNATSSAGASTMSLEAALKTASTNKQSLSIALETQKANLENKTEELGQIVKAAGAKFNEGDSLAQHVPSVYVVMSFAAAVGFVGLAFVL